MFGKILSSTVNICAYEFRVYSFLYVIKYIIVNDYLCHLCGVILTLKSNGCDTILVNYHEYYSLLLARAQMIGRLLLEWRTKQVLEYEKRNRQYTNEEMFQDDQMIYLLAPHSSVLQTDTTKFKQDFIGPLFIDTAIDKTHYRLKDATGLLLDGTYHMNRIKKGSVCTPQGIVDTYDGYQKALKNTLLNKLAIETPDNKIQEVTLKDGSKELNYLPGTIMDYTSIHS